MAHPLQDRMVAGIGETVLDIVFRNKQPQAAVPGGRRHRLLRHQFPEEPPGGSPDSSGKHRPERHRPRLGRGHRVPLGRPGSRTGVSGAHRPALPQLHLHERGAAGGSLLAGGPRLLPDGAGRAGALYDRRRGQLQCGHRLRHPAAQAHPGADPEPVRNRLEPAGPHGDALLGRRVRQPAELRGAGLPAVTGLPIS